MEENNYHSTPPPPAKRYKPFFQPLLKKSQGFSLVGVMMAAGMVGGLSLALMHIMKQLHEGKRDSQSLQDQFQLHKEISLLLADENHCRVSLAGDDPAGSPVTFKKADIDEPSEGLNVELFTSNRAGDARSGSAKFYPNRKFGKWKIESLKLQLDSSTGSHTPDQENKDLGNVVVKAKRKINERTKTKTLKFPVQVKVSTAPGSDPLSTLLSCSGETATGIAKTPTGSAIRGSFKIGIAATLTCDADSKGTMKYNETDNVMEYCNSTNWVPLAPSQSSSIDLLSLFQSATNTGSQPGSGCIIRLSKWVGAIAGRNPHPLEPCPSSHPTGKYIDIRHWNPHSAARVRGGAYEKKFGIPVCCR